MSKLKSTEISTKSEYNTIEAPLSYMPSMGCIKNEYVYVHSQFLTSDYFADNDVFAISTFLLYVAKKMLYDNKENKGTNGNNYYYLSTDRLADIVYNFNPSAYQKKKLKDTAEKMIKDKLILCCKKYCNGKYLINISNWKMLKASQSKTKDGKANNQYTIINENYTGYYQQLDIADVWKCLALETTLKTKMNLIRLLASIEQTTYARRYGNQAYRGKIGTFTVERIAKYLGWHRNTLEKYLNWLEDNKIILVARSTVSLSKYGDEDKKPKIERASNIYAFYKNKNALINYCISETQSRWKYVIGRGENSIDCWDLYNESINRRARKRNKIM